jgi:hypothetical protein
VGTGQLRLRFKGTEGDFWYLWSPWEKGEFYNVGAWNTITIPITDFKDNYGAGTNSIQDMSSVNEDFGMAFDGGTATLNLCIDNVRFHLNE